MVRKVVVYSSSKQPPTNASTMETTTRYLTWTNQMRYANGSVYKGSLDRYGNRTGFGILRTCWDDFGTDGGICMEYNGDWCDDKPDGWGSVKRYRGDATTITIYEGVWANGVPVSDP